MIKFYRAFIISFIYNFYAYQGKCKTCGDIRALQKTKLDKTTQMYCSQAHLMHRGGLIMLERAGYTKRRIRAMSIENKKNKRILSIIIGMFSDMHIYIYSFYFFIYFYLIYIIFIMF